MKRRAAWGLSAFFLVIALLAPSAPRASDHADPLNLTDPNATITGLFIFPKDDQYVLIFNVRRALTNPKPCELSAYEYEVSIDLTTPVTFHSAEDRARYGGYDSRAGKIAGGRINQGSAQRRHQPEIDRL